MRITSKSKGSSHANALNFKPHSGFHESPGINIDEYVKFVNNDDARGVSTLQISPHILSDIKKGASNLFGQLLEQSAGPFAVHNEHLPLGANGMAAAPMAGGGGGMIPPQQLQVAGGTTMIPMQMQPGVAPQAADVSTMQTGQLVPVMPHAVTIPGGATVSNQQVAGMPTSNIPIANVVRDTNIAASGVVSNETLEDHYANYPSKLAYTGKSNSLITHGTGYAIVFLIVAFLIAGCIVRIRSKRKLKNRRY